MGNGPRSPFLIAADYLVTGTVSPNCTGGYHVQGTHDGEPVYRRHPTGFWLWYFTGTDHWVLSVDPPNGMPDNCWRRQPDIEGAYTPIGTNTGTPTVTIN